MTGSVHKLYLADSAAGHGSERLKVFVDDEGNLKVGRRLSVPLRHIESCEVTPAPDSEKRQLVTIVVRSPSLNAGEPTPVYLIHVNFWGMTKTEPMQEFVDEVQPLISDNTFGQESDEAGENFLSRAEAAPGTFEVSYCLNLSLLIVFYHKTWIAYDTPGKALAKTWLLLLVSVLNVAGILLLAVPFYNWGMAKNIERVGYGRGQRLVAYWLSLLVPFGFWAFHLVSWLTGK